MKKLIAGTFAVAVMLLMGAISANAQCVVYDSYGYPYTQTVSYSSYNPYYDYVTYYDRGYSSSYSVRTVSYRPSYYVPTYRTTQTIRVY